MYHQFNFSSILEDFYPPRPISELSHDQLQHIALQEDIEEFGTPTLPHREVAPNFHSPTVKNVDTLSDELVALMLQEEEHFSQHSKQIMAEDICPDTNQDEYIARLLQEESTFVQAPMIDDPEIIQRDELLALELAREQEKNALKKDPFIGNPYIPIIKPFDQPAHIPDVHYFEAPPDSSYFEASPDENYFEDPPYNDYNEPKIEPIVSSNIDTDSMSYEQLLELGERIGTVSKGLSVQDLSKLPVHTFTTASLKDTKECSICQEQFMRAERLKTLPCFHIFHEQCIDQWLKSKCSCPICLKSFDNL